MAALPAVEKNLMGLLQTCRYKKNISLAARLLADIECRCLETHPLLGNYLVVVLVECGSLPDAVRIFHRLPQRSVYSWSSLLSGYVDHGQPQLALQLYQRMEDHSLQPNTYMYVALLKACARLKDAASGHEIHATIMKQGLERDVFVGSSLVDMYGKCGSLEEAHQVLDKLPVRDAVSWNSLISRYIELGYGNEARKSFKQMQFEGIYPSEVTVLSSIKACGMVGALDMGQELHLDVVNRGLDRELHVGTALVDLYCKCGLLHDAREVFHRLPVQDAVSWTALIAGYAEHGFCDEALSCFELTQHIGISPDALAFTCSLKACSSIRALQMGYKIHMDSTKQGLEREFNVGTAVLDMYAKCGSLPEAQCVLDSLSVRDVVSWTALIAGYAEYGFGDEALRCFEKMELEDISPVTDTFACSLKACSITGALDRGQELHAGLTRRELEKDCFVGSSIIDMYSACGLLVEAQEVFDKLPVRDVASWNAMIKGYGDNHRGDMAVQCFKDMQEQGLKPDTITFTCLLAACSQASLVSEGQEYFRLMNRDYAIEPKLDHYACIVDLLARSGLVDEAERFVEGMQCIPSKEILRSLLNACKIHGHVELGLKYFHQLVQLNQEGSSAYLLMADIYASAGRWNDANSIEELRINAEAKKKLANASVEVHKKLYEFLVGINQSKVLLSMLDTWSSYARNEGYVPNLELVLRQHVENDTISDIEVMHSKISLPFVD